MAVLAVEDTPLWVPVTEPLADLKALLRGEAVSLIDMPLPFSPLFAQSEADAAISSLDQLGSTPYIVLGCYLVLLLVLGVFGWLRSKAGEEDYYLAGREQGWIVSSLTIMATFFSSFALLGAPGLVYREGLVFALFSLTTLKLR